MASLQWISAAAFLYVEIFVAMLLCLPFISNSRWRKIFNSRIVSLVKSTGNYAFIVSVIIMVFLFLDSVMQERKYARIETSQADLTKNPHAEVQAHMKLFRAQRNCYITGFALFMLLILRRLVSLISAQATLEASHEAAIKQAKGATEQCRKLLDENEELKKGGAKAVGKDDATKSTEASVLEENEKELREKDAELKRMEKDLQGMKTQAEGLSKEYDRVLDENEKLQKKLKILGGEDDEGSKKDN